MITTQRQLRQLFWTIYDKPRKIRGEWPTDIRCLWCDFIDSQVRNNQITESLAQKATLS